MSAVKRPYQIRGQAMLDDLSRLLAENLRQARMPAAVAEKLSARFVEEFARCWGGARIYVPCGHASKLAERDRQIRARFNGANHRKLAAMYGVTVSRVYQILRQAVPTRWASSPRLRDST